MKRVAFKKKLDGIRLRRTRMRLHSRPNADRKWMIAVRQKDDFTCQRCGKYELLIHTHHVNPRSRRPDLKHEISNGKCLCLECHNWVHNNPIEATRLGLLSTESYELSRKEAA
jgi:5-methylcytosine-specific restriction endonuclease McrA